MELALACDLRVMAADALIGMPETRVGLIPDVGGSSRLPAVVGLGRAKELVMTGRMIDGTEAERIGLVNRVAPAGRARRGDRRRWSASCWPARPWRSATPSACSTARPSRRWRRRSSTRSRVQELCARTEDFTEGTRAFAEKRQPEFSGR